MRKVHYKVVLDILVYEDECMNSGLTSIYVGDRLRESGFIVDPDQDALGEFCDVIDITIESVEVTDSR